MTDQSNIPAILQEYKGGLSQPQVKLDVIPKSSYDLEHMPYNALQSLREGVRDMLCAFLRGIQSQYRIEVKCLNTWSYALLVIQNF